MTNDLMIFAGTANPDLARSIAGELGVRLSACRVERFPDGETLVILDEPVRGREVFVVQPTAPPVNDHLVELLAFADACRRASAARTTAIMPYFGYARSDKRDRQRVPVAASMVADLLQAAGINHVVTVDVHTPQLEGFFRVPVDSLTAVPALVEAVRSLLPAGAVVVSPDAGRVRMATEFAQRLKTSVVVLHKQRESGTQTKVVHLVGDVRERACLVIDDMISTGGTMGKSIEALLKAGARPEIIIAATHGLLLEGARENLSHEGVRAVFVTDTVPVRHADWSQLKVVSVAPLIAAALRQFMTDGSLSALC
ncbi:MAG: phosphoribosylpyrophosphate synthetase [Acidobacteria bacterium]|nr:MAG: phosphoribosylpyrophosphate synthetase [Acidobacteriota bacterium]